MSSNSARLGAVLEWATTFVDACAPDDMRNGVKVSLVCPGLVETPIYDTSPIVGFDKVRALALWPKGISPEVCAAELLRGVDKNQAVIVVTPLARALDRVQRLSPRLFLGITELYMGRLRKTRSS